MQTMNFVGERRGDFVQELSYKWVGDGHGEFDMAAPPRKRPSYTGCLCLIASLLLFGVVVAMNIMTEKKVESNGGEGPVDAEQGDSLGKSSAHLAGDAGGAQDGGGVGIAGGGGGGGGRGGLDEEGENFDCDLTALHPGDLIQAAFDISFRPVGFVAEGSLGRVAALLPSAERFVIVDWHGFPQLQGSKVQQEQLVKALRPGDRVEAIAEVVVRSSAPPPAGQLGPDDLLFLKKSLPSGVPEGTAGYISTVLPPSEDSGANGPRRFRVDFPDFPQFPNSEVSEDIAIKAPRVADRVVASRDIHISELVTVPKGSAGQVAAMMPQRGTYTYKVQWQGLPDAAQLAQIGGLNLKVAEESYRPAPLRIPRGAMGNVVTVDSTRGLYDERLAVAWDGLSHTTIANVSRGQVDKVPDWSKDQRETCCMEKRVACPGPLAQKLDPEPFSCDTVAPGWNRDEANWCCENRNLRCDLADDGVQPSRPLFNCKTKEVWPKAKASWCCTHEKVGCEQVQPL